MRTSKEAGGSWRGIVQENELTQVCYTVCCVRFISFHPVADPMKSLETSRGFMSQSRRHKPLGDLSWGSISSPPLRFGGYGCGNRILRDPYERLVAQFRGTYRLEHPELLCDVDAGVKMMLQNYLAEVQAPNRIRNQGGKVLNVFRGGQPTLEAYAFVDPNNDNVYSM